MLLNWLTAMAWIWAVFALLMAGTFMKKYARYTGRDPVDVDIQKRGLSSIAWAFLLSSFPAVAWIVARWM